MHMKRKGKKKKGKENSHKLIRELEKCSIRSSEKIIAFQINQCICVFQVDYIDLSQRSQQRKW